MGNSPALVNSPHKGPVTRKMFPFDDVIMVAVIFPYDHSITHTQLSEAHHKQKLAHDKRYCLLCVQITDISRWKQKGGSMVNSHTIWIQRAEKWWRIFLYSVIGIWCIFAIKVIWKLNNIWKEISHETRQSLHNLSTVDMAAIMSTKLWVKWSYNTDSPSGILIWTTLNDWQCRVTGFYEQTQDLN